MLKELEEAEDPAVVVYLLGNALTKFNKSTESDNVEEFVEVLAILYPPYA